MFYPQPFRWSTWVAHALGGLVVLMLISASAPPIHATGSIIYVNALADGANTGTSWTNAYPTLTSALSAARPGDTIWVAGGTYRPTSTGERTATFTLKAGVAIYGGFVGTEHRLSQRDWMTNVVTLSGDLQANDVGFTNMGDNSYHVVTGATGAILDGVVIRGGNASEWEIDEHGGGLYNVNSSPILTNVIISGNDATYGGGMANIGSSPILTNVTISGNAAIYGGGMWNEQNTPVLDHVTISGNAASYGGGMWNKKSTAVLTNVAISSNTATQGGGILNIDSSPVLTNLMIISNTAVYAGGGIFNTLESTPILTAVTVSGNTAARGGGIENIDSSPILTHVTISDNTSSQVGGGIANTGSSPVLTNVTISGNIAIQGGGGVYNVQSSPVLTNAVITDNTAQNGGGILASVDCNPVLTNVTISRNTATERGGGLEIWSSPVLTNVTITDNTAQYGGGMVSYSADGTSRPRLTHVTISGNTVTQWGGGMVIGSSRPVLTNVTISGNSAHTGGGLWNSYGNPSLTNVTITGNAASATGGGLYTELQGKIILTNVTVSGNTAPTGGGFATESSSLEVRNSIVWGNSSSNVHTNVTPVYSFSLVQNSGGSGPTWDWDSGTDAGGNLDRNPLFVSAVPMAPTVAGDVHLQASSPAIDSGSNVVSNPSLPSIDRDRFPRIGNGTVDMGAYEQHGGRVFLPIVMKNTREYGFSRVHTPYGMLPPGEDGEAAAERIPPTACPPTS